MSIILKLLISLLVTSFIVSFIQPTFVIKPVLFLDVVDKHNPLFTLKKAEGEKAGD